MIFGALSGLKKVGISLLGREGSGIGTSVVPSSSMMLFLGRIFSSLSQYRAKNQQLSNNTIFSDIKNRYGVSNMSKQVSGMLTGALSSYGRSLESANRAGGVMPNYSSSIWNMLSEGWNNYNDDLNTLNFNAEQMYATFSAHRVANQLSLLSSMINTVFDAYKTSRYRVPQSRTYEEKIR